MFALITKERIRLSLSVCIGNTSVRIFFKFLKRAQLVCIFNMPKYSLYWTQKSVTKFSLKNYVTKALSPSPLASNDSQLS